MLTRGRCLRGVVAALVATVVLVPSAQAITMSFQSAVSGDPAQIAPVPDGSVWQLDRKSALMHADANGRLFSKLYIYTFGLPAAIAWGPDGMLWATGDDPLRPIIRVDLLGNLTNWAPLPSNAVASGFALGPDGSMWFTEKVRGSGANSYVVLDQLGRVRPNGTVQEYGGLSAGSLPGMLTAGPDGNMWFVESGTNRVGRITPTGAVTEFPLPAGVGLAGKMTVGPDGALYLLLSNGKIGRMDMSGTLTDQITGGLSDLHPNAIALGRDGNLWLSECKPDAIVRLSLSGLARRFTADGLSPKGCPIAIASGVDGIPWFLEWDGGRLGRITFDAPAATTGAPSSIGTDRTTVAGIAAPQGAATTVRFQYGTTTAYGATTAPQAIGDGDADVSASATLEGLQPGTAYHYRVVATSPIGTTVGADRTVTTAEPPPPAPPAPPVDADDDGYPITVDCNDTRSSVHPGATDAPGNRVDEDCSGADAAYQRFSPRANAGWTTKHRAVTFTRLVIDEMPAGSSLDLRCTGPGCKARRFTSTAAKTTKHIDLAARLKRAKLRRGAVVELRLSRPGYITTVVRWTVGPPPRVSIRCLPPGAIRPQGC